MAQKQNPSEKKLLNFYFRKNWGFLTRKIGNFIFAFLQNFPPKTKEVFYT
jgi:hypothetical protein